MATLISGLFGVGGKQQHHGFGGHQEFDQVTFGIGGHQPFQPTWQRGGFVPPGMAAYGYGGMNNGVGSNPRAHQLDLNPLDA